MECYPFENLPLPYSYDALEPFIDEKTMKLHHERHLATYIKNLNEALSGQKRLQNMTLKQLICCARSLPKDLEVKIKNNAGGVYNHRFFFDGLTPNSTKMPIGRLDEAITACFGGFEGFKKLFKQKALEVFGSGYAWLAADNKGRLCVTETANQQTPLEKNMCPVLTIDVWEHAYYLKHYNLRADYIDDWFNVVNWQKANEIYGDIIIGL